MISPFALYYYSAYGPVLRFLDARPQTAWLADFFLPHFSETSSTFLNGLRKLGNPIFWVGFAIFAIGFVTLYGSKLLRRGRPVTWGLYRWVCHPQYLGLVVMGVGVLLFWPRIAVLVALLTMLFLYSSLARSEERRCLAQYGDSYRAYVEGTWMFFPGLGPRGASRLQERSTARRVLAAIVTWALLVAAGVWSAYRLRDYSLARVSHVSSEDVAILSPALLSPAELNKAVDVAWEDSEVAGRLAAAGVGRGAKLLVYVVPAEWRLPDLPMEVQKKGGHYTPEGFTRDNWKVLFTRPVTFRSDPFGDDIIRATVKRQPIVLVRVNTRDGAVEAIERPPATVRWGDIPTPLF